MGPNVDIWNGFSPAWTAKTWVAMERKAQAAKAAKASQSKQKQAEAGNSKQKQAIEPARVEVQNEFHTSWCIPMNQGEARESKSKQEKVREKQEKARESNTKHEKATKSKQ